MNAPVPERTWPYGDFVGGFLLDFTLDHLVVAEKRDHTWQAGKWTAITDNIFKTETPKTAMARVWPGFDWKPFAEIHGPSWVFNAFYALAELNKVVLPGDARWVRLADLDQHNTFGNVPWLAQMAKSIARKRDLCSYFQILEK